jgi:shikimate dehydrogenase
MADSMRRAFICGHPVAHSRSPLIHGYWLRDYGIEGTYERMDISSQEFPRFLNAMGENGFVGGNITIPHKEMAYAMIGHGDEASELIGAVNTVWLEDGVLRATNTDWSGFSADLDARAPRWRSGRLAVVLGAGGAARGIVYALSQRGYDEIRIVNRTFARARELADRFGGRVSAHEWGRMVELVADADIVVNTTALGMAGKGDGSPESFDLSSAKAGMIAVDIVYIPLLTPFLKAASERGLEPVDGLGMLLHQAVPGFERWFGRRPDVTDELRQHIIADMEAAI